MRLRTPVVFVVAALAVPFLAIPSQPASAGDAAAPPSHTSALPAASANALTVAVAMVPVSLQRRAETFLGEQRSRDRAWEHVRGLAPRALPVYDPGEDAPAYFAFAVENTDRSTRGYVLLTTDDRDFPVLEAPEGGQDIVAQLRAAAPSSKLDIARVVRLGPHSYVAENARREQIARIGRMPFRVEGVTPDLLDLDERERQGDAFASSTVSTQHSPAFVKSLRYEAWSSYADFRAKAASHDVIAHEMSRRNAAGAWRTEHALQENALVVPPYATYAFALLEGRGSVEATREGTSVSTFIERDAAGRLVLRVVGGANVATDGDETRVRLSYADGTEENLRFAGERGNLLGTVAPLKPPVNLPTHPIPLPTPKINPQVHPAGPAVTIAPPPLTTAIPPTPRPVGTPLRPLNFVPLDSIVGCAAGTGRLRTSLTTYVGSQNTPGSSTGTITATFPYELSTSISIAVSTAESIVPGVTAFTINGVNAAGAKTYLSAQRDPSGNVTLEMVPGSALNPTIQWRIGMADDGRFYFYSLYVRAFLGYSDAGNLSVGAPVPFENGVQENHWADFLPICTTTPGEVWTNSAGSIATWADNRKYDQIPNGHAPNDSPCYSGCGATAWAMLFGWADAKAATPGNEFARANGLFKSGATKTGDPSAIAPELLWTLRENQHDANGAMDPGAAAMIWEIRSYLNDWGVSGCGPGGERFTGPWIMAQAHQYFASRADVSLTADYDGAGGMTNGAREDAKAMMTRNHRPVILGIGSLLGTGHYPLGIGWGSSTYKLWNRTSGQSTTSHDYFMINMGWGLLHVDIVPPGTWFRGGLHPTADKGS